MQNSSNTSYSAIEELKLVEILVNYNNEIVSNAIKYLKEGKSIKNLRIRENQVQWYKKIYSRLTPKTIEKLVNEVDLVVKRFRGVLNGDPWNGIKSIVLSLSA